MKNIETLIELVKETKRIPIDCINIINTESNSVVKTAVQLDMKCMSYGWKLSPEFLFWAENLSKTEVSKLDYLISFVFNSLGLTYSMNPKFANFEKGRFHLSDKELFDLFCFYGQLTHTYEEYVKNKEKFTELALRNFVVLNLGKTFEEEMLSLIKRNIESSIPLSKNDLDYITKNSDLISNADLESFKPTIKENVALLNKIKYERGLTPLFLTTTDLLRFIVAMNNGDITLTKKTKFKKFPRVLRKSIFLYLDSLSKINENYIADALSNREEWKRIGEKIHPHESKFSSVKTFFSEVRKETTNVKTTNSKLEKNLASKNKKDILSFFKVYPTLLSKCIDRVLRENPNIISADLRQFYKTFSNKVIISLIQHFRNRQLKTKIYTNKKGSSFCDIKHDIKSINPDLISEIIKDLEEVLFSRIKSYKEITVAKELETVAIPLSNKLKPRGIGILPIGSETQLSSFDTLRFFIYWHQKKYRTDYDLSTLFLDKDFKLNSYVSFTKIINSYATHSGDITSAPDGASEFIDIKLNLIPKEIKYIVPQINIFVGEVFDETKEVFFGFMERNNAEMGKAFEPKTVKFKSELQGKSKVSLPVLFVRNEDGSWTAKWMHLGINSTNFIGMVERNCYSTSLMVKAIAEKNFFKVGELIELYRQKQTEFAEQQLLIYSDSFETENLKDVKLIGPNNLQELISW